ncbi:hypothetical protein [Paraburkholderia ferrariae]|uniref:Uncharacterized protein n=1 Tax=Paraburkholderia ferrariae TaxID=386056 RepID=A0ABU9S0K2_9BURK
MTASEQKVLTQDLPLAVANERKIGAMLGRLSRLDGMTDRAFNPNSTRRLSANCEARILSEPMPWTSLPRCQD